MGGILVLNAVWMLSTNALQCGLSTQIRSPRESSMYTCGDRADVQAPGSSLLLPSLHEGRAVRRSRQALPQTLQLRGAGLPDPPGARAGDKASRPSAALRGPACSLLLLGPGSVLSRHPIFSTPSRGEQLTLTKISGQFSSSSYAAMSRLHASTDTKLFPLALKLMEASRRSRLQRA